MSVFVQAPSQNSAWNSNMSVWWPSGTGQTFANSVDLMCSSCSTKPSFKKKRMIIYSSIVSWHEPCKVWCSGLLQREGIMGDPSGNTQPLIPSLLTSAYFCTSLLCRLKIKVRIWVAWIHLWKIVSARLELLISWCDQNISPGHMWGTADQLWLTSVIVPTGWKARGWLKMAARLTSALFVLLRTENMHVSSLSKHARCDKVQLWVPVGFCVAQIRQVLIGKALKLPLASPWKRMEPVCYNYNHTVPTNKGGTPLGLRRQFGSELKETQKITWKISKWCNYFHCGLAD